MTTRRAGGGRPPKPENLKLIKGTSRTDRNRQSQIGGIGQYPDPPDYVTGAALDEWNRIQPLLEPKNVICELDQTILGAYCIIYARLLDVEERLNIEGPTIETKSGPKPSALFKIWCKTLEQLNKVGVEIGFSPLARQRLPFRNVDAGPDDGVFEKFKNPLPGRD